MIGEGVISEGVEDGLLLVQRGEGHAPVINVVDVAVEAWDQEGDVLNQAREYSYPEGNIHE